MTSPLAKLVTMKSYPLSRPSWSFSATSGSFSSGTVSKGTPLWEGTRISLSPSKGCWLPPLKKKVTWAYFSLSARWSWVFPRSLITWARVFCTLEGAKAMGR